MSIESNAAKKTLRSEFAAERVLHPSLAQPVLMGRPRKDRNHPLAARLRVVPASQFAGQSEERRTAGSLQLLTLTLALLAAVIFILTDADGRRSASSLWIQIAAEASFTLGAA